MSAFEPPHHQRSFSYPNPSLPPFSNLYSSPGQMNMYPPKRQATMSSVNSLQPVSTTLPLLTPMDFSRYTTVFNNTPTQLGPQISHDRFQPVDGTDGTPQTQHATLPSTPTEPTSAPANRTSFMDAYINFGSKPQDLLWQPEETREFITPSRIGQGFAPMSLTNELPVEAFPRSHSYAQPQQEYMAMNMMRFEQDDEEATREAHLAKTRRHVCPVCNKRFNRPSSLNTHMAVHTGAKPFQCSKAECGRRFSVSSNLRRHEKTHMQGRNMRRGNSSPIEETAESTSSRHQTSSSWGSAHSLEMGMEGTPRPQSEQSQSQPFVFGSEQQVYHGYNGANYDEYPYAQPPMAEGQLLPGDLGQYQVTREAKKLPGVGGL